MYCVAPIKIGANEVSCNQETTSYSPWCQKHIKHFGGITSKYHELETKLKLDPFDYEKSHKYMKWTNEEIEDEFRLLWRIYNLRLKLHQYGFASGIRDVGHEHRLSSINNCLSILNNMMKIDEMECEECEVEERGDMLSVNNKVNTIRLTAHARIKKIKEQEFVGIWNQDDVVAYCKKEINAYILTCLRKYFQRWPNGDLMFEYSITMASEMCFIKIYEYNPKLTCKINIKKFEKKIKFQISDYNAMKALIIENYFGIIPILSVIKSYNIRMSELLDLAPSPSWLIKRFAIGHTSVFRFILERYFKFHKPHYHPDIEDKMVRRYSLLRHNRIKIPQINIPTILLAIKNNDKPGYMYQFKDNNFLYRSFLEQDIKLFKSNIKSLCQFEENITEMTCECELLGIAFIDARSLYTKIKRLLSKDFNFNILLDDNYDLELLTNKCGNLHPTFWWINDQDIIDDEERYKRYLDQQYAKYGNNILF